MSRPILIAGPTASGKSSLALALAREVDGVIINADSAQVYEELEVITARPSQADMDHVPHRLYGHVSGNVAYSTGAWLEDVTVLLSELAPAGKRPIIVGGTGLYFQALLEGLSNVPEIEADVRVYWRAEADRIGAGGLYDVLLAKDPLMAVKLNANDTQRIVRALEVIESTGRSLKAWQDETGPSLLRLEDCDCFVLSLERGVLYERIDERFAVMVQEGGLEEVRTLYKLGYDSRLPIMRALGVPELGLFLQNELSLEQAILLACQQSRRYAKRQMTWLRRNMITWNAVCAQEMERNLPDIVSKICNKA